MSWQTALVLLLVSGCGGPETQVEGTWADVETVLSSMERQEQVSREVVTELEAVDVRRLVLALSDGHPTLAQAAARLLPRWIDRMRLALARDGGISPPLPLTFHDLVPGVGDVLDALAGMAGDGWLLIEAALADQDARTVQQAGRILSRAPSRLPRLARLFAAARGNSFGVQVAVVRIVGTLPKPSAVGLAIIARAVGAADVDLRLAGAWALAAGAPLPAFAHRLVREAGHDRDPRVQLYAAVGAVKCGDELLQSEGRALIHGVTRGSEVRLQIALLECMDGMPSLVGLLTGELAELLCSDADIDRVAGDWGPDGMRWWVGELLARSPAGTEGVLHRAMETGSAPTRTCAAVALLLRRVVVPHAAGYVEELLVAESEYRVRLGVRAAERMDSEGSALLAPALGQALVRGSGGMEEVAALLVRIGAAGEPACRLVVEDQNDLAVWYLCKALRGRQALVRPLSTVLRDRLRRTRPGPLAKLLRELVET